MSDETVEVTVKLPKPPEGWEYTGEYRWPQDEFVYNFGSKRAIKASAGYRSECFILRRVAPPERMVMVPMTESDLRWWERQPYPPDGPGRRFFEVIRAVLAEVKQEACGMPICMRAGGIHNPVLCDAPTQPCALPKGHEGGHRP